MMAFHQDLESGLDFDGAGVRLQAEHVERLALGVAHQTAVGRAALRMGACGPCLLEQTERIVREKLPTRIVRSASRVFAVHADFPGRTMAGDRLLLITGDRILAHSGKKIVGMIVFAYMVETKPPIFALAQASLGGAMGSILMTIRPIANWIGSLRAVLRRLHADAIEQG